MIYLLVGTIFLLLGIVIYLVLRFLQQKSDHDKKIEVLRGVISELRNRQLLQIDQIRLSEELRDQLAKANTTLSRDIEAMITEFIGTLYKNDLLEK